MKYGIFIAFAALAAPALAAQTVNFGQAEAIALALEPGTLRARDEKILSTGMVYEFEIVKEDGTVMEIEIDGNTGAVLEHKIDELPPDPTVPEGGITQQDAEARALQHALSLTDGKGPTRIKDSKPVLYAKYNAYEVDVEAGYEEYTIFVDIKSGKVLSAQQQN